MNDFSVLIYFICFACLTGATFAYMYAMMTSTLRDFNRQQEKRNVHPEMADVKTGDELLILHQKMKKMMMKETLLLSESKL